jgi:hypothetical protein
MARDIFSVISGSDYKLKMLTIQFVIDLVWKLNETLNEQMDTDMPMANSDQVAVDLLIESLTNLMMVKITYFNQYLI